MVFTRRGLLQAVAAAPAAAQNTPRAPNIVFLISDDHTAEDLGCYGNQAIRTPNLDRLAAQGAQFKHCYVASPQCSPNRSAIFTGCTPHTTSTSRLHTPMPEWEPSFLEPLKLAGYFTGAFRKVHQGKAFDRRWDYYGDFRTPFRTFFEKLPAERPFFLHVGFTDPHRPYKPGVVRPPHDPASVRVPEFLPDTPEIRQDLAHYADAIARMDGECGEVLRLLEESGRAENTLVIFTGDNGMPFPGAKGSCYDPGIHVPLIARWPGRIQPGVRNDLVSHVDLPVAFLEAAGIARPAKMQGVPFLSGPSKRNAVFSERNWHNNFDPIRSIRTAGHKLIFNAAPHFPYRPAWDLEDSPTWAAYRKLARQGKLRPEHLRLVEPTRPVLELYDLEKDPHEFRNVADAPEYAQVRLELMKRLGEWMEATYDFLPPAAGKPGTRDWPLTL